MAFGLAETAELAVRISLKDDLSRGIDGLTKKVGRLQTGLGKVSTGLRNAARNLTGPAIVGGGLLAFAVKTGLDDLSELESAVTSVDGAIKQMGLTGKLTGAQIAQWADEIEEATGAAFDDKAITAATENLIRYGKVTDKNIRPAMEVMTDLAAKTGDVESASTLLGKALADPAKAAGKLARMGIVLTKAQQKQIKAFIEANDLAGAQNFLLTELAKTTAGAAEASQGKYARAMSVLADVQEDARKALAEGFLPVLEKVAGLLSTELAKPQTLANIRQFGEGLAAGLDSLVEIARKLPWGTIGTSLQIAGAGAKAILNAFTSLPPWVQTAVLTGWGLNKLTGGLIGDLASGLVKGVLGMNAGVVNIRAGVVNGAGGMPGAGGSPVGRVNNLVKLGLGLTGVGIAAMLASEFEDEIQGLADDLATGWRTAVRDATGVAIPKIDPGQLEWPFGPKNTPTILPELVGGNGILGGTPAATKPSAATNPQGAANAAANAASIAAREGSKTLLQPIRLVESAVDGVKDTLTTRAQGIEGAVQNAQSIATREASATRTTIVAAQAANAVMMTIQAAGQAIRDATQRSATETAGTKAATASTNSGTRVAGAVGNSASRIVSAIWAARPIINVTTVNRHTTTNNRYGPTGGSSNTNRIPAGVH